MEHHIYETILRDRNLKIPTAPLWTMFLNDDEINDIRLELISACRCDELEKYGREAALYYAYWWQNIYSGGSPSREDVVTSLGLPSSVAQNLYMSARKALKQWNISYIRAGGKTHYFRTLLSQGGLPIRLIQANKQNFGNYKQFLSGLIRELSHINIDWNNIDFVQSLSCTSYLPVSFKNEGIYDLSLQIAHAIIENRSDLLPYNSSSGSLKELTDALKREHEHYIKNSERKPFTFIWELILNDSEAHLFYTLECNRSISSESIPELDVNKCYQFDVYVDQRFVGTYKRVQIDEYADENFIRGIYRGMNISRKTIEWKDETFIEVKIACDYGKELFLSSSNCYPPNFDYPQIFQKESNGFVLRRNRNNAESIALYTSKWILQNADYHEFKLCDNSLKAVAITDSITFQNSETNEIWEFESRYIPYNVELSNIYVDWIEYANYKLLPLSPLVTVYDEDNQRIFNVRTYYRKKGTDEWSKLMNKTCLPEGLIEIKVHPLNAIPWIETFYSIPELFYNVIEATSKEAIVKWHCTWGQVKACLQEGIQYTNTQFNQWSVLSQSDGIVVPATCSFSIYKDTQTQPLRISIAAPFKGVLLIDSQSINVKQSEIISFDNLANYRIIQYGLPDTKLTFSYQSKEVEEENKYIKMSIRIKDGITPLSNYEEMIERLFNLYGFNSFDRCSSVTMSLKGAIYLIRKFVYDSQKVSDDTMALCNTTELEEEHKYEGKVYAYQIDYDSENMPEPFILKKVGAHCFQFPALEETRSYIVFSGEYDIKRIVPKFYQIDATQEFEEKVVGETEEKVLVHRQNQAENIKDWKGKLEIEKTTDGHHWEKVVSAFAIATRFRIPFGTFNQISAAVSTPKLFARFILAMYLNSKNSFVNELLRLEQEFAIGVHWLKSEDIDFALDDLKVYPDVIQDTLFTKFPEFIYELLSATLNEEFAKICFNHIGGGPIRIDQNNGLTFAQVNELCARAHGHDDNGSDMPSMIIQLSKQYYNMTGRRGYHYTMLNSSLRVFEHMASIENDLWNEDMQLRRVINFYRKYYMRAYCDVLELMFN